MDLFLACSSVVYYYPLEGSFRHETAGVLWDRLGLHLPHRWKVLAGCKGWESFYESTLQKT